MAVDRENKPVEKKIFEEETKDGMNVVTNMNGEERANKKLEVADVSDKMNTKEIQEYLRRAKKGEDVNKYLDKFNLKKIELDQLAALAAKRDS